MPATPPCAGLRAQRACALDAERLLVNGGSSGFHFRRSVPPFGRLAVRSQFAERCLCHTRRSLALHSAYAAASPQKAKHEMAPTRFGYETQDSHRRVKYALDMNVLRADLTACRGLLSCAPGFDSQAETLLAQCARNEAGVEFALRRKAPLLLAGPSGRDTSIGRVG